MTYSPPYAEPVPPVVSPLMAWGPLNEAIGGTVTASATWGSANRGIYMPIWVQTLCPVRRLFWVNGDTVSASYNVEVGLYADTGGKPGAKIVTTGSQAQGSATSIQIVDNTDLTLVPSLYWLFMSCSNASATFYRGTASTTFDELVRMEQTSVGPGSAPATATPIESTATDMYLCGFFTTSSP